jgi:DNA-binding Lrp family transcriptional regulator
MVKRKLSGVAGPSPVSAGHSAVDETDLRIVEELVADGRLSVRALAERVHISRASAYARLERLQADGVITGFSAQVVPEKVGLGTSAYISISIEQNTWRTVAPALDALPAVERVCLVSADFDVVVEVRARDNHELRNLVLENIHAVPGVKSTRTWLIFQEMRGEMRGEVRGEVRG